MPSSLPKSPSASSQEPTTSSSPFRRWWDQPCGGREVLAISLPLVASMISWTIMNFVDRMFLLWYSTSAMAAAMPTGMFLFSLICFPMGIAGYASTFVAQYEGSGNRAHIGRVVWQAFAIGVAATPLLLLSMVMAPTLFRMANHTPELQALEVDYYRMLAFGAGAMVCSVGLSTFFTGRGETRTVMLVDMTAALLNVVLDYLLIFGHAGFPEMGISGAGLATTISQWYRVVFYLGLLHGRRDDSVYEIMAGRRWDGHLMRRLFRFGGPEGLRMFVDVSALSFFLILVGRLGTDAMTATTLAFNVNSVAFVPMLGIGTAVSVLVGQQVGRNRIDLARRATYTALMFAMGYALVMAILYVAAPDMLMAGHAAGADPEDFVNLRETTVVLLRFVAAYCLFDACLIVFVSAIKGAGDTWFVLWTTVIMAVLLVVLVSCGMSYWHWGLMECWTVLTVWVCIFGVIFAARFWYGAWEHMRVIETDTAVPGGAMASQEELQEVAVEVP